MFKNRFAQTSIASFIALLLLAATQFYPARNLPAQAKPLEKSTWKQISLLVDREINESSGLILSGRNDDCFWTHNDSGDSPRLFLVHRDGRTLARLKVAGAKAIDWEDIAIATIDGSPKIIIGDIGGNAQKREHVTLYILSEPPFPFDSEKPTKPIESSAKVEFTLDVTFKGGVTNYEGIAVDQTAGLILIFEKALLGGRVYSVPFPELSKKKIEIQATYIGQTSTPYACACDVSADSKSMIVISYFVGYLFSRRTTSDGTTEEWSDTFQREPVTFKLPKMRQAEAVCFSKDSKSIFLTSEQLPTPLIEMTLPITGE